MPRRRDTGLLWLLLASPVAVSAVREFDVAHHTSQELLHTLAQDRHAQTTGHSSSSAAALAVQHERRGHGHPHGHDIKDLVPEALSTFSVQEIKENNEESELQRRAEKKDGFLVTAMLIGAIVFDMTVLYLLNSSDPQVRSYSFKMCSTGIIVFCALLVESAQHSMFHSILHWIDHDDHFTPELVVFILLFLFWYSLVSFCSWKFKDKKMDQYGTLSLAAHICAFTALEYFGLQQEHTADHMMGEGSTRVMCLYLFVPFLVWLIFRVTMMASNQVRKRCLESGADEAHAGTAVEAHATGQEHHGEGSAAAPADHQEDNGQPTSAEAGEHDTPPSAVEGEHHPQAIVEEGHGGHGGDAHGGDEHGSHHHHHDWKAEAFHAEADAMAIVVGFLIKQCIVYIIQAHPVPMDCAKYPIKCRLEFSQMAQMLIPAAILYLALIVTAVFHARQKKHRGWLIRQELVLGMTISWVIVQVSEWAMISWVWDHADTDSPLHAKTVKKLLCASVLSPLLVLAILYVDSLADRAIIDEVSAETTVNCIAFLIGFYWEKVFMSAIKNVTKYSAKAAHMGTAFPALLIGLGLLCCIMPAWRWFIVPTACEPVPPRKEKESSIHGWLTSFHRAKSKLVGSDAPCEEPAKPAKTEGLAD